MDLAAQPGKESSQKSLSVSQDPRGQLCRKGPCPRLPSPREFRLEGDSKSPPAGTHVACKSSKPRELCLTAILQMGVSDSPYFFNLSS